MTSNTSPSGSSLEKKIIEFKKPDSKITILDLALLARDNNEAYRRLWLDLSKRLRVSINERENALCLMSELIGTTNSGGRVQTTIDSWLSRYESFLPDSLSRPIIEILGEK